MASTKPTGKIRGRQPATRAPKVLISGHEMATAASMSSSTDGVSSGELASELGIHRDRAKRILRNLVADGYVKMSGEKRTSRYFEVTR